MTPPTILCGTDLTPLGTQAARVAAALAATQRGSLLLVHVQDAPTDDFENLDESLRSAAEVYRKRIDARRARAQEALDGTAAELRDAFGIPVRTERVAGRPCEAILDVADAVDAALVVIGPHGEHRGRLMDRLLGTTALRVVRHARRPVLVVGGDGSRAFEVAAGRPSRVLVGVDFASGGAAALAAARAFPGAELLLAHAMEDPFAADDTPLDWGELRSRWREDLETRLMDLAGSSDARFLVAAGDPGRLLPRLAIEHRADLLVVGTHQGGALSRLLLGSTAERVLRESPVPVLVVPPPAQAGTASAAA